MTADYDKDVAAMESLINEDGTNSTQVLGDWSLIDFPFTQTFDNITSPPGATLSQISLKTPRRRQGVWTRHMDTFYSGHDQTRTDG
ncbi:hypothetical protein FALBO_15225 [Fusarium albosuccineum]|uniref:Uncharacterized protein n=1 Tax=Fusarium albosuccineum TaxID=1237068 RepID=A0A8H4KW69_9HYPO|nr:hypothetical protein FALBO_15225 [Fusarium albosuccineum]